MREPIWVCQFLDSDVVEARIADRHKEDMNLPEWNQCGICCVRMMALGEELDPPPIEEMYRTAFDRYSVFKMIDGKVIGAYHRELAEYMINEFGFDARTARGLSVDHVRSRLDEGSFLIASVGAAIRDASVEAPERRNGHLVLVFANAEIDGKKGFFIHNSSGYKSTNTQSKVFVSTARFGQCFSGTGIIISNCQE